MARTPETLTAAKRAAVLGLPSSSAEAPRMAGKTDNYMKQARASLSLGLPTRQGVASPSASLDPKLDPDSSFMLLSINDIEPYGHNPRVGVNPRYEEIKESVRADGITNALTVTRKPGASKYHPYGGGNTRLRIARELYEEGDARFSQLGVFVRAWRGDAKVISAHLADNELRGDISFWEKAQGAAMLKDELQREQPGKVIVAGDLNKELKAHGINFGIKVIQNFFFAIEHLAPIGPWLQATAVNESIRPAVGGILAVADRFKRAMGPALTDVLIRHAEDLKAVEQYNDGVDPEDRKPVVLDVEQLVAEVQVAAAQVLGVPVDDLPLMVSAIEAESRISAEDLRNIRVRTSREPAAAPPAIAPPPAPANTSRPADDAVPSQQRSLAGMLAPLPTPTTVEQPLTGKPAASGSEGGPINAPDAGNPAEPATASTDSLATLTGLLLDLSDLVSLHDVLLQVPQLPFGFMVDIPASLSLVGDQQVAYPRLRAACWKLLAALSHQLDPRWFGLVSAEQSTWVAAIAQGQEFFIARYGEVFGARCDEFGSPEMGLGELQMMFSQPEVGRLVTRLFQEMDSIRTQYPHRFAPPGASPKP